MQIMASNSITGDSLVSKIGSKEQKQKYDEGFDRIFKKKDALCNICGKTLSSKGNECAYTGCPLSWDEDRVDTIGQNGNDGLHYDDV
jgi:tRNA(Ile2) C34 agmatinyltransferase TiaS